MKQYLNMALGDVKPSAIREFSALAAQKEGCIGLTLGEPDFDTPKEIIDAAKASLDHGDTHYIANTGSVELREAISNYEKKQCNRFYDKEEIIVTVGATEGIFVALFGILNPGDEVIVPTPAFGLYESTIALCRGKFVPMPTGENHFQISREMLDKAITSHTKAIILNSPNNPTGCVLNEESLENVYQAVKDKNIFIITDEVYQQLIYTDTPCPLFTKYSDMRAKTIVIQSFSKPYAMTGWRVGYLLCDQSIKADLAKIHQYSVVSTTSFLQNACIAALDYDISEMREIYRKRRDYVLKRLDEMGLQCVRPEGGFYVFPSITQFGMSSADFCKRMIDEVGLALTPGYCFGDDDCVRLTYCYQDSELEAGLDRLEEFIKILKNEA